MRILRRHRWINGILIVSIAGYFKRVKGVEIKGIVVSNGLPLKCYFI